MSTDNSNKEKIPREIRPTCKNCWFYYSNKCNYNGSCNYEKRWSNILNSFIPENYIEQLRNNWNTLNR